MAWQKGYFEDFFQLHYTMNKTDYYFHGQNGLKENLKMFQAIEEFDDGIIITMRDLFAKMYEKIIMENFALSIGFFLLDRMTKI